MKETDLLFFASLLASKCECGVVRRDVVSSSDDLALFRPVCKLSAWLGSVLLSLNVSF